MNILLCNEELEIFDEDCLNPEGADSIISIWQTKKDNLILMIQEGYIIKKTDDGYGNEIYEVKKGDKK